MIPAARQLVDLPPGRCLWGVGDPREAGFRWCGCRTERGRPYCREHVVRASRASERGEVVEAKAA